MVKILQKEHSVLRKKAKKVSREDIASEKVKKVIEKMKKALHSQEDGVAIAAPQIGESLCIFVISGKAIAWYKASEKEFSDAIYINPEIVKSSKEKMEVEEGCLSVRPWYGLVRRNKKVTLKYQNMKGEIKQEGGSGLMAQIFQHEIDHLNGILFTDKAKSLEEIPLDNNADNNDKSYGEK